MKYTILIDEKMTHASSTLRISQKNAVNVCRALNRKKFSKAKEILEKLEKKEISLKGKYYNKTVKEITKFIKCLETNARSKNLDPDPLYLFISAHRGPVMHRARRRWRKFGTRMKICHVQAVLSEKDGFGKKVRERRNKK